MGPTEPTPPALDLDRLLAAGSPPPEELEASLAALAARADREGLIEVAYARVETPIGELLLAATDRGLARVALPGSAPDVVLGELATLISPRILERPARLDPARRELEEYFAGRRRRFELELDRRLSRPGFVGRVQRQIEGLGFGETATYGELAARAGSARAHRAAGTACGANPIPIVVPCHRVVPAAGGVGSYAGGPELKRRLLRLEGVGE